MTMLIPNSTVDVWLPYIFISFLSAVEIAINYLYRDMLLNNLVWNFNIKFALSLVMIK